MSRESDLRKLVDEAHLAHQREQEFFAARLKTSMWSQPDHGEVEAWSASLQAVEAAGWTLAHWSTSSDSGGNISAYPVFRRRRAGGLDPTAYESRAR